MEYCVDLANGYVDGRLDLGNRADYDTSTVASTFTPTAALTLSSRSHTCVSNTTREEKLDCTESDRH